MLGADAITGTWEEAAARAEAERRALKETLGSATGSARRILSMYLAEVEPVLEALHDVASVARDELVSGPLAAGLDEAIVADVAEWAIAFLGEARALLTDGDAALAAGLARLAQRERDELLAPAAREALGMPGLSREPRVGRQLQRLALCLAGPALHDRAA